MIGYEFCKLAKQAPFWHQIFFVFLEYFFSMKRARTRVYFVSIRKREVAAVSRLCFIQWKDFWWYLFWVRKKGFQARQMSSAYTFCYATYFHFISRFTKCLYSPMRPHLSNLSNDSFGVETPIRHKVTLVPK